MAFCKTLIVNNQDIYIFQYKATRLGRVYRFWRQIIERMPMTLRNEVRAKPTYLNLVDVTKKSYQFQTSSATYELKNYLKGYKVKVIDDRTSKNNSDEENI